LDLLGIDIIEGQQAADRGEALNKGKDQRGNNSVTRRKEANNVVMVGSGSSGGCSGWRRGRSSSRGNRGSGGGRSGGLSRDINILPILALLDKDSDHLVDLQ